MLIALQYHLTPEAVAHKENRCVVLKRRWTELSSGGTCREGQEPSQRYYVEVPGFVSLELIVKILQVTLSNAAAVVEAFKLHHLWINLLVLRCHLSKVLDLQSTDLFDFFNFKVNLIN